MTTAMQMRLTHFVNFFWVNRLMLSKLTVTKILRGALVPSAPQEYPANPTT